MHLLWCFKDTLIMYYKYGLHRKCYPQFFNPPPHTHTHTHLRTSLIFKACYGRACSMCCSQWPVKTKPGSRHLVFFSCICHNTQRYMTTGSSPCILILPFSFSVFVSYFPFELFLVCLLECSGYISYFMWLLGSTLEWHTVSWEFL